MWYAYYNIYHTDYYQFIQTGSEYILVHSHGVYFQSVTSQECLSQLCHEHVSQPCNELHRRINQEMSGILYQPGIGLLNTVLGCFGGII